jgi:hypothetical protein
MVQTTLPSQNNINFTVTHEYWPSEPGPDREVYWRVMTENNATPKYLIWDVSDVDSVRYEKLGENLQKPDMFATLAFETIPSGDWNVAHLSSRDEGDGLLVASTAQVVLVNEDQSFDNPSLPRLDVSALLPDTMYMMPSELEERSDPQLYGQGRHLLPSTISMQRLGVEKAIPRLIPYLGFSYERYHESRIYSLIAGHDIAPRILANVTEHGTRPVGWVIEHVASRFATARDTAACRAVLAKLHGLGISYGLFNLKRDSFLIVQDGPDGTARALLQDFTRAVPTWDESELRREMDMVEGLLAGIGSSIAPSLYSSNDD